MLLSLNPRVIRPSTLSQILMGQALSWTRPVKEKRKKESGEGHTVISVSKGVLNDCGTTVLAYDRGGAGSLVRLDHYRSPRHFRHSNDEQSDIYRATVLGHYGTQSISCFVGALSGCLRPGFGRRDALTGDELVTGLQGSGPRLPSNTPFPTPLTWCIQRVTLHGADHKKSHPTALTPMCKTSTNVSRHRRRMHPYSPDFLRFANETKLLSFQGIHLLSSTPPTYQKTL